MAWARKRRVSGASGASGAIGVSEQGEWKERSPTNEWSRAIGERSRANGAFGANRVESN